MERICFTTVDFPAQQHGVMHCIGVLTIGDDPKVCYDVKKKLVIKYVLALDALFLALESGGCQMYACGLLNKWR